ncbi:cornichon protein-domain-containing protein [Umbelopsis sp. AD052]|nr:cornichon protein-domain-containing protein [Umbelopsis sp. AD052]
MSSIQQISAQRDSLKAEINSAQPNLAKCAQMLTQLKIGLTEIGAYVPQGSQVDPQALVLARDILEMGAYYSVRVKDIDAFVRYISQLSTFYYDYASVLPPSEQMYPLTGLNLLRLLSQNRLSEFHTALEVIDPEQLHNNSYIKHAVDLEQFLMEGSYNKVWSSRSKVKGEEFLFFYNILIDTIRHEIANCSEKAYEALPVQDAATLLFMKNMEDVLNFAQERNWKVNPAEQKIYFTNTDDEVTEIPQEQIIKQTLTYARELERIMPGDAMLFLFGVIMAAFLLFMMVFFVIMFSDLECDYINPIDLCNKLNQFVLPEMGAQAFLFAMFLINGSWLAALLNLPLVVFNVQKVTNNRHMYDATEIFRTLSIHKKECFFKLAFYLLVSTV